MYQLCNERNKLFESLQKSLKNNGEDNEISLLIDSLRVPLFFLFLESGY